MISQEEQTSTLDVVDVENVRDSGIIETESAFAMIVAVEPTEWLTISEEQKSNLYSAFFTFLRGLEFPAQFVSISTDFDISVYEEHLQRRTQTHQPLADHIADRNAQGGNIRDEFTAHPDERTREGDVFPGKMGDVFPGKMGDGEDVADISSTVSDGGSTVSATGAPGSVEDSRLLEIGRQMHSEWLNQIISLGEVRDREYYVVVAVEKEPSSDTSNSALPSIVQNVFSSDTGSSNSSTIPNRDDYLDEVWARAQRVASQLPRTGAHTSVLDSRAEVMEVLIEYYRHESPSISPDRSAMTEFDDESITGDVREIAEAAKQNQEKLQNEEGYEPRPTPERPFNGRVDDGYHGTVKGNSVLEWYVRNVGPIGGGPRYSSPKSVYAGAVLFLVSLVSGIAALGTFFMAGQNFVMREIAFVLAAVSLPLFLCSLIVLLPSGILVFGVGTLGFGISGVGTFLFQRAYPRSWDLSSLSTTKNVLAVYGAGILLLVGAVGIGLWARRNAIITVGSVPPSGSSPRRSQ